MISSLINEASLTRHKVTLLTNESKETIVGCESKIQANDSFIENNAKSFIIPNLFRW